MANPAQAAARSEQYFRNMLQIQRQEAKHVDKLAAKFRAQDQRKGQQRPAAYQNFDSNSKHKPAARQQVTAAAPPADVVLPPDVTVRQLAQLLGKHHSLP